MPLRLDNAKSVAHMPTAEQQQTKKDFKPRFKVDHAASPMPEIRLPERLAPGRHQNRNGGRDHLGILGEIKSVHPGEIIGIRTLDRLPPGYLYFRFPGLRCITFKGVYVNQLDISSGNGGSNDR